ncbi:two-component response regulator ARR14-like [Tripterygium wilfordii]|uniref:Two-component response regulator ARR14-like n=1 Tax=Tripterygium wilfordii TaxID=458696 RepID=A0A7J7CFZ0_TRIWF|nr:two-component response regulator ARR14-like [Tripterygium wilfordii]
MKREEPISVEITEEDDASSPVGVRVLLVESNFTCLAILSKILRAFGYKVITARRAADALSIVRAKENELDLILTETQLPDMDKDNFSRNNHHQCDFSRHQCLHHNHKKKKSWGVKAGKLMSCLR